MTEKEKIEYFKSILENYHNYRDYCKQNNREPDSLITYACLSSDVGEDDVLFNEFFQWSSQF